MTRIALMVVYNHRYDKNIPLIEKLYQGKFSFIYHIVPFYDGDKENVIPVYENSYFFGSYIAQAYTHLKGKGFTHYFVVADDMVINPRINEQNVLKFIGIGQDDCFIRDLKELQHDDHQWGHLDNAIKYKVVQDGVEVKNLLPSVEEAKARFGKYGISTGKMTWKAIKPKAWGRMRTKMFFQALFASRKFSYPILRAYSDIFLVPETVMPKFCLYLGAFSATKLFVEAAIPTSLILISDNVKVISDTHLKSGDKWGKDIQRFGEQFDFSVDKLIQEYPEDVLFYHPIKLSKWRFA